MVFSDVNIKKYHIKHKYQQENPFWNNHSIAIKKILNLKNFSTEFIKVKWWIYVLRKWKVCIMLTKIEAVFFLTMWYLTFVFLKYTNENYFIFCCVKVSKKYQNKKNTILILRKRFSDHFSQDISLKILKESLVPPFFLEIVSDIWDLVNVIPGLYFPLRRHFSYRTFPWKSSLKKMVS